MKILNGLLGLVPISVLAVLAGVPAQAITLYQSSVNTASGSIPSLAGSPTTTLNDFTAAASSLGSISVVTFEGLAVNNFYASGSGTVTVPAAVGTESLNITVDDAVPSANIQSNGISNFSGTSTPYGFNTTLGGANFLRINNGPTTTNAQTSTTFSFSSPVQAFGTYITDYGNTNNGILTPQITFVDGTTANLDPVTRSSVNGNNFRSVLFYGFIAEPDDPLIASVTFAHSNVTSQERYGFDDIRFVSGPRQQTEVPEPSLVLGTLIGGGLCLLLKSKKES